MASIWRMEGEQKRADDDDDDDDDDDEEDGQMGVTEEEEEEPQSAPITPSPLVICIAQRFHHDGLHSIFRWLTVNQLNVASRACKRWYAASTSPSFHLGCDLKVGSLHPSFHCSALRHHVSSLHLELMLTIPQLSELNLAALNRVEKLKLVIDANYRPPTSTSISLPSCALLPPHLTSLQLEVQGHCSESAYVERSVKALLSAVTSCHRLESLMIDGMGLGEVDFTFLPRLIKLRSFEFLGCTQLSVGLAHGLRELPHIDEVSLRLGVRGSDETRRDFLRVLCSAPSSHIKSLLLASILRRDDVSLLSQLPSLTSLHAEFRQECSEVLPCLRLRDLTLHPPNSEFLSAVSRMSTLTRLALWRCRLSSEMGEGLVSGLRRLETLSLNFVTVDGGQGKLQLAWLKQATSLRTLSLTSCKHISEESLYALRDTTIQTLILRGGVRLGMWAERCLHLALQCFQYIPPPEPDPLECKDDFLRWRRERQMERQIRWKMR